MNSPAPPTNSQSRMVPAGPYTPSLSRISRLAPSSTSRHGLNLSPAIRSVPPLHPVHLSPVRRKKSKKRSIYNQSDEEVWDLRDDVIVGTSAIVRIAQRQNLNFHIAAALERWTAACYSHYDVSLRRHVNTRGKRSILFRFTCKHKNIDHSVHERARENTAHGTTNLKLGAEKCDSDRGVATSTSSGVSSASGVLPYSAARHRAIIALRCASSQRPFNVVADKYYRAEVELLRPGTSVPSPSTVSDDIKWVHLKWSQKVVEYFKVSIVCSVLNFVNR